MISLNVIFHNLRRKRLFFRAWREKYDLKRMVREACSAKLLRPRYMKLFLEATDRKAVRSNAAVCRIDTTVAIEAQAVSENATTQIRGTGPIIAIGTDMDE